MPRRKKRNSVAPPWERLSKLEFNRLKSRALNDLWAFLELIHFYGGPGNFGDVHKELAEFLMSTRERRLILMPRGHLKSTFASTLYVMWRIYRDPNIRIMVGTANKENLASAFVREVKQYFENRELKEHVWNSRPHIAGPLIPNIDRTGQARAKSRKNKYDEFEDDYNEGYTEAEDQKVVWRADKLQVVRDEIYKEPTLTAASVGSPNTGEHYDLVIFDDLVTYDNSDNLLKAGKVKSWTYDIESVLNPYDENTDRGDEIIILGTRYFSWDYYSSLLGEDIDDAEEQQEFWDTEADDPLHLFNRNIYANGVDSTDGYLWPEGFDEKMEKKLRRRLPTKRFASQYLNTHLVEDGATLGWHNVRFIPSSSVEMRPDGLVRILSADPMAPAVEIRPMLVLDPAASTKATADWTAMAVGGKASDGSLYIIDLAWGHWTPTETIDKLMELTSYWRLGSVTVESVGGFANMKYSIKEGFEKAGRMIHIVEYRPKGDKKERIELMLQPLLNNEQLHLAQRYSSTKEVKEEFTYFPSENVRDDIVDVVAVLHELSYALPGSQSRSKRSRTRAARTVNSKYGGTR